MAACVGEEKGMGARGRGMMAFAWLPLVVSLAVTLGWDLRLNCDSS